MNKDNDDIRKELEELEKLIDKVKKQNEEEKKKQKKRPQNTVVELTSLLSIQATFGLMC